MFVLQIVLFIGAALMLIIATCVQVLDENLTLEARVALTATQIYAALLSWFLLPVL